MDPEIVDLVKKLDSDWRATLADISAGADLYSRWNDNEAFVNPAHHIDYTIETNAPAAGDLNAGEVRLGDATGPNGRDEIFWSVDGNTVARVEADSEIT